ncbi:MAG: transporter [Planctomycetia bacterium]|nr:transporter [Planctomycetia bacterium]
MHRSRWPAVVIVLGLLVPAGPGRGDPGADAQADLGTDRDAFTPNTHTVSPGTVLTEGSYVFIDNFLGRPTNNYPELLVRIGGNDWFEWRFGVNYGVGSQGNIVTSVEVGEGPLFGRSLYESSLLYGFKADLTDQHGLVPESCFIMEASTPTYGDVFGTVPVATYVAGYELPAGWKLDAAIRYAYSEGLFDWFDRWSPSVVLRVPLTERWEVHAEYFDTFTKRNVVDVHRAFFSPGTHYLLTKHLEIGLRVGWGVTPAAAPFFSDAGFGWRW